MSEDGTGQGSNPTGYLRVLHPSVRNNASAYGFSVTITVSFGLLTSVLGTPTVPEIFAFAGGAVAAFALVEFIVAGGYRHELTDEPSDVKNVGSSVSILSVGAGHGLRVRRGETAGRLCRLAYGILLGHVGLPVPVRHRTILDRLPPAQGEFPGA